MGFLIWFCCKDLGCILMPPFVYLQFFSESSSDTESSPSDLSEYWILKLLLSLIDAIDRSYFFFHQFSSVSSLTLLLNPS
jgi:hypothetical protein